MLKEDFYYEVDLRDALLNKYSRKLPNTIKSWVNTCIVDHVGYYRKNKSWSIGKILCMDCGKEFVADNFNYLCNSLKIEGSEHYCPHCGAKLYIEVSRKKTLNQSYIFCFVDYVNGLKATRVFEGFEYRSANDLAKKEVPNIGPYYWEEVLRVWDDEEGNTVISSLDLVGLGGYFRRSPWRGSSYIKRHESVSKYSKRWYAEQNYADIREEFFYPQIVSTEIDVKYKMPVIEKLKAALNKKPSNAMNFFSAILTQPMFETMAKAGYEAFAAYLANRSQVDTSWGVGYLNWEQVFTAVKICIRNHYPIDDPQLYHDYLKELAKLELDFHNAHYVCPADLLAAHAETSMELQRREERRRREQEERDREYRERHDRMEAERKAKEYARNAVFVAAGVKNDDDKYKFYHGEYLGIEFGETKQNYKFHVLQDIEEFRSEGKAMKHCVYSNGYYNNNNCLIISCRNQEDKRVSTSEIDLKTFKIVQTRAACNQRPEHFNLINDTINQYMYLIKDAAERQAEKIAELEEKVSKAVAENSFKIEAPETIDYEPCCMARMLMDA